MARLRFLFVLCAGAVAAQIDLVLQEMGFWQDLHIKVTADAAAEVEGFQGVCSFVRGTAKDDGHQQGRRE